MSLKGRLEKLEREGSKDSTESKVWIVFADDGESDESLSQRVRAEAAATGRRLSDCMVMAWCKPKSQTETDRK